MKHSYAIGGSGTGPEIKPATGLPMIDDHGGVDVGGNPYGTDLHDHGLESGSPFDPFGRGISGGHGIGGGFPWD